MKSWVIDPVTKQRYLLVTTSGAPAVLAVDQEFLLLRNDLAIMQALEANATGDSRNILRQQLEETKARVALLDAELDRKAQAA